MYASSKKAFIIVFFTTSRISLKRAGTTPVPGKPHTGSNNILIANQFVNPPAKPNNLCICIFRCNAKLLLGNFCEKYIDSYGTYLHKIFFSSSFKTSKTCWLCDTNPVFDSFSNIFYVINLFLHSTCQFSNNGFFDDRREHRL